MSASSSDSKAVVKTEGKKAEGKKPKVLGFENCYFDKVKWTPKAFKGENAIWVDQKIVGLMSLTAPPAQLPGGPSWKPQSAGHRRFCESLVIHQLGGKAKDLYERWELCIGSHKELIDLLLSMAVPTASRSIVETLAGGSRTLSFSIVMEGSKGRGGFLSGYMDRLFRRPSAALGFAIQVLGSR